MGGWKDRAAVVAAALWWGSLTTIGFLVVRMLFAWLPTPALAGNTAGRLFAAQTWVSLGCCLLLLIHIRSAANWEGAEGAASALGRRAQLTLMFVAVGALLALLQEYAVAPRIMARENLKIWHAAGSLMYLVQWACATAVLWRQAARAARP